MGESIQAELPIVVLKRAILLPDKSRTKVTTLSR